jgi:hypothetical protein
VRHAAVQEVPWTCPVSGGGDGDGVNFGGRGYGSV